MSQPTPYNRLYSFTDFQTVNPTDPLPATELDAELNAIALTAGQIRANLGLIQRDDGALANQSVTPDSLSTGALAMIHQGEYAPRGAWGDAVAYVLGDVVTYNAATYLCIVAHTSVTQFATDLAAGKWLLIANGALTGGGQAVDLFEGNGSTTAFTLSFTYAGNNAAVVFVGGVAQIPGQDFTISGTTITFVAAPPAPAVAGRKNVMVRGTGVEAQLAADLAATSATNAGASATAAANSASAASASQTAAAASQTAAAGSATSAAASATTATNQASTATTQATNSANSATAAAASQSAAATSATNAAGSATAAAGSASTATTQATTATNQATAAANSATAASNSATAAAGSASTASGAATTATTQASNASTSATAASTSATNAANSASQASTSASNAAASASSASSSSSSASTSATNAAASATTATTQATAAGASAAAALASQNAAATSATNAATQATNASGSATAAASSASSAAASAAAAAASLDNFDDRYLGPKSADPTVDNDGNALVTGALYYRTTAPIGLYVWGGSAWESAPQGPQGATGAQGPQGPQGPTGPAGSVDYNLVVAKSGSTMTGHLNVPSLSINSGSPTLDLSDTTTGRTRRLHHNEDLMGFLKTDGNWDMYMNNGGSMWTANYGWLHDYFFSSISNCSAKQYNNVATNCNGNTGNCSPIGFGGEVTVSNCGNITTLMTVLEDGGSTVNIRTYRYNFNCACNCDCC